MMNEVFFKPWVGRDYESGGIFGKKIMVLGESHYCSDNCGECGSESHLKMCGDFTTNVVDSYIYRKDGFDAWMPTFTKFERSLVGEYTDEIQRERIWHSILFYNYLQVALQGSRQAGKAEDYESSALAFFEVLKRFKPDYIVVWGYRLWDKLPGEGHWEWADDIIVGQDHFKNGYYILEDGTKIKTIPVKHPSAGYSWDYWHNILQTFMM